MHVIIYKLLIYYIASEVAREDNDRCTFVHKTTDIRSVRLKQRDRTCWTIQTHSDELNWAKHQSFHDLTD